jgi:hypothetical protein
MRSVGVVQLGIANGTCTSASRTRLEALPVRAPYWAQMEAALASATE